MNVALAGGESAGLQLLHALARSNHHLVAVLASPPKPGSSAVSVWNAAKSLGFEPWPAKWVKDPEFGERLRSLQVDILLNVLAAPRLGAFNLHPGPLPRYAGRNVVSWAIFRGESMHGVTVHRMDPEIDAGPIAYQTLLPIEAGDSGLSLSLKCAREGVALVLRLLEVAAGDPAKLELRPQDLTQREYFGGEVPEGGRICWSWAARKVVDFVRACDFFPFSSPWGYPRARLGVQGFALVKARQTGLASRVSPGTVGESTDSGVLVACQDEWILVSKLLLGDRYIPADELLRPGIALPT
jgi:methionyl-tRNA formyltransferase